LIIALIAPSEIAVKGFDTTGTGVIGVSPRSEPLQATKDNIRVESLVDSMIEAIICSSS
jgi:hypothetical protein